MRFQEHHGGQNNDTVLTSLQPTPSLKGGNAHYQFKDDIQDIKGDKKVYLSNLNSVYHTRTMNV